jgi:hypothetical protein
MRIAVQGVTATVLLSFLAMTSGRAQLVIDPLVENMRVEAGVPEAVAIFSVRNAGKNPIKILEMRPSCTCLSVTAENTILAGGENTKIVAKLRIGDSNGLIEKEVAVRTDEGPEGMVHLLGVDVEVPIAVTFTPKIVVLTRNDCSSEEKSVLWVNPKAGVSWDEKLGGCSGLNLRWEKSATPDCYNIYMVRNKDVLIKSPISVPFQFATIDGGKFTRSIIILTK